MLQRNLLAGFFCATMLLAVPAFAGVTVASPSNGSTVPSSVHVVASASASSPIVAMRIYVDDTSVYLTYANSIDTYIPLSSGGHYIVVQSWDSAGQIMKAPLAITVLATAPPPPPPNAKVFSNIDQMTGWESCDRCSGVGGNGPTTPYWQAQFQTSPSLDGSSSQFFLGGSVPYASALWWKQLGGIDSVRFFRYDVDFFFTDAQAPGALEFDVNQSVNGRKYIFGTECDFTGDRQWRVWDFYQQWQPTGVPCTALNPNVWHHLTWEFERTVDAHTHYIAVTVDGVRYPVNRYYQSGAVNARELNVAFQMDGNSAMTPYHVWLDRVQLAVW
jgi:hypothetical protein